MINFHKNSFIEVLFISLVILGGMFFYSLWQPQILHNYGMGWDGQDYINLFKNFLNKNENFSIPYPVCKRVAFPYLGGLFFNDSRQFFLFSNLLSGFFSALIFFLAVRKEFNFFISFIGTLPLIFYIFSPIRYSFFLPYSSDALAVFLYSLALFFIIRKHFLTTILLLLISSFFRESGLYFALALLAFIFFTNKISKIKLLQFSLVIFAGSIITTFFYYGECDGSQLRTILAFSYLKLFDHNGFLRIFAAILLTLAPFILIKKQIIPDFKKNNHIHIGFIMIIMGLLMAVFGGGDTSRVFYTSYPLYAPYLLSLISREPKLKVSFFALGGLIINKIFMKIPEPQSDWPNWPNYADTIGFFSFFPDYADITVSLSIISFSLIMVIVSNQIDWKSLTLKLTKNYHLFQKNIKTLFPLFLIFLIFLLIKIYEIISLEIERL